MYFTQFNPDTFQMISSVQELPTRWTTPDGATINNFNTLPQAALLALCWAPVVYEPLPSPESHQYSLSAVWNPDSKQFVYAAIPRDLAVLLAQVELAIDQAASDACARYLSTGVAQDLRYNEKAKEIERWQTAYLPRNPDDYPVMAAEASACGVTLEEKVAEIATVREAWVALCAGVEALRIGGKRACAACTEAIPMLTRRDEIVDALRAL